MLEKMSGYEQSTVYLFLQIHPGFNKDVSFKVLSWPIKLQELYIMTQFIYIFWLLHKQADMWAIVGSFNGGKSTCFTNIKRALGLYFFSLILSLLTL